MSFAKNTLVHLSVLFIIYVINTSSYVASEEFKANVIKDFAIFVDNSLNETGVCLLGLSHRREKCKFAINSAALKEFNGKVVFGSVSKASIYEFEYLNPVNGNTKTKTWAVKCPTKPLIFIANGNEEDHFEVFVKKDS